MGLSIGLAYDLRRDYLAACFLDPTTNVPMRVWIDPATGDRRYVAEG